VDGFPPSNNVRCFGVPDNAFSGTFSGRTARSRRTASSQLPSSGPATPPWSTKSSARVLSEWELDRARDGNPVTVTLSDGRLLIRVSPVSITQVRPYDERREVPDECSARARTGPSASGVGRVAGRGTGQGHSGGHRLVGVEL